MTLYWKISGSGKIRSTPPVKLSCKTTAGSFGLKTFISGSLLVKNNSFTRRRFLQQTALATAGFGLVGVSARAAKTPNEKLNIGIIGVANQGHYDLTNVASQNVVALCDVNDTYLAAAATKFPAAKTYSDF